MKPMKAMRMACTLACGVTFAAQAAEKVISWQDARINLSDDNGDSVTVSSVDHTTYPDGLPTPSFWLDASATSGWTVSADGQVSRIPSKVGTRALSSDFANSSWKHWDNAFPVEPLLTYDTELGANVLDFGKFGSRKCLVFDAEQPEGCTATNKLSSIGTMIAIYGSQENGGWLFGGGLSAISWHRGSTFSEMAKWTPYNPLVYDENNAAKAFYRGYTRHDGYRFIPYRVGFTGGWEVFSFSAQTDDVVSTLAATGLGIGDARGGMSERSGGMKIAEMIIYPTVLTTDQIASVEDWLRQKWFGTSAAGVNGHARIDEIVKDPTSGSGTTSTITVNAGETLEIGALAGGRTKVKADAIELAGAGTVKLADASHYQGSLELNGSKIVLGGNTRAVPTADQLPAGLYIHFDPSDTATITTEETEKGTVVRTIGNKTSYTLSGRSLGLTTASAARAPILVQKASPTGLPVLDFLNYNGWGAGDRYMEYVTKPMLTTAIAVVDTRRGGSWLMNRGFARETQSLQSADVPLLCSQDSTHVNGSNNTDKQNILSTNPEIIAGVEGCAYLDGERVGYNGTTTSAGTGKTYNRLKGYPYSRFVVVALQVPGTSPVEYVGGYNANVCGSLILGEMLCWARPLNEQEIRDASAYLAKKWLGRTLPGYADTTARQVADVQNIKVTTRATVDVPAGTKARIETVTLRDNLVKTGAGELQVGAVAGTRGTHIEVKEGTLVAAKPLESATWKSPADEPAVWFDPSDTNGWVIVTANSKPHVVRVSRTNQRIVLRNDKASDAPFMNYTDGPVVNGVAMPVVDFGTPAGEYGGPNTNSHSIVFDHPVSGTRSVFTVWLAKPDSYGFLMGSSASSGFNVDYAYDWHRGTVDKSCKNGPLFGGSTASVIYNGTTLTNGVACKAQNWKPSGDGWHLIETHTKGGVHVSAFGADRGGSRVGGIMMGETLIYDRVLTEREKVATRNYLMQKWFGTPDEELTPLPDATATTAIPELVVDEDTVIDDAGTLTVKRLVGEADFTKQGAGTLAVDSVAGYTGTLHVAAGTFKISSRMPTTSATLPEGGLLMQLDAERGVTTTEDGVGVTEWASANGSGWKAVSAKGTHGSLTISRDPLYEAEDVFEGRMTVNVRQYSTMRFFNPAGEWASITNVKSALWVLGSKNGGGLLLGGGDHTGTWMGPDATKPDTSGNAKYYAWHRGSAYDQSAGQHWEDSIICGSGHSTVTANSAWYVNGTRVDGSASKTLSGAWDTVSMQMQNGKYGPTDALSCDGRIFAGEDYTARAGNQRLAELLIYTNCLSNAERIQAEEYLNVKWGLNNYANNVNNRLTLDLAAGTTFDSTVAANEVYGLGGDGTVEGSVSAHAFTATYGGTGLTVNGTLTIAENPIFAFDNLPDTFYDVTITVATASAYEGAANLKGATFEGLPAPYRARASIKDGKLVVRIHKPLGAILYIK